MSDPLRTDTARAVDAVPADDRAGDLEREAKIEQLLLLGLDHYFAARYEHAITVWTRALFLDRSHPRARAYIERARSAMAERLRESEELLQNGVAAFRQGQTEEARRLLQAAMDGGAPMDEALPLLDRLNRLDALPVGPATPQRVPRERGLAIGTPPNRTEPEKRLRVAFVATLAFLLLVLGFSIHTIGSRDAALWRSWFGLGGARVAPAAPPLIHEIALAPPTRGELALDRARELATAGRLHDALAALDRVRPTDSQKPEADRLRADLQRQLLRLERLR